MTKAIIFDMGGVLVDLDIPGGHRAYKEMGFQDVEEYLNSYHQMGVFGDFEEGRLDEDEFFSELAKHCRPDVSREQIRSAYIAILGGIPQYKIELLNRLSKEYKVYMLSNNNPFAIGYLDAQFGKYNYKVDEIFTELFCSFRLKMQKPAREIYKYALDHIDAEPEEILFIDDSVKNVDAAKQLGIRAVLYRKGENLDELVTNNI